MAEPETGGYWAVNVNILIPRDEAKTDEEATDLLGERLKPWAWSGNIYPE